MLTAVQVAYGGLSGGAQRLRKDVPVDLHGSVVVLLLLGLVLLLLPVKLGVFFGRVIFAGTKQPKEASVLGLHDCLLLNCRHLIVVFSDALPCFFLVEFVALRLDSVALDDRICRVQVLV